MDEPDFTPQELPARVEKHLSYEEVVEHLTSLEGQEQIIRIALGPAIVSKPSDAVVKVFGVVGRIKREEPRSTDPRDDAPRAAVWIGSSCRIDIPAHRMTAAVLVSIGPEIKALIIDLDDAHISIQDVVSY